MPDLSIDYRYGLNPTSGVSPLAYTRADPATRTTRGGLVEAVPAGRFRTNWVTDTPGTRRGGLLVEGARTNLTLRSEEFDNAAWTKTDVTVTANNLTAPDGTATADLLTDTGSSGRVQQTMTVASGATVTWSVYLRRVNQDWARIQVFNGADGFRVWFNLATGAVGTSAAFGVGSLVGSKIEALPNGWYRCSVTGSITGQTSYLAWIVGATANASILTADTAARHAWGAQLELGSFASSYIPTVAATVTRATDQVSYANFPQPAEIAARGGITVYQSHVDLGTRDAASGATLRYFQLGAGAAASTNRILRSVADAGASAQLGNGSAFVTANISVNPALNSFVERVYQIEYRLNGSTPEFRLRVLQFINGTESGSTAFTGWLDATALIANGWQTAPTLHIGARDGGNNPGFALHQQLKSAYGVQTIDYMRALV